MGIVTWEYCNLGQYSHMCKVRKRSLLVYFTQDCFNLFIVRLKQKKRKIRRKTKAPEAAAMGAMLSIVSWNA